MNRRPMIHWETTEYIKCIDDNGRKPEINQVAEQTAHEHSFHNKWKTALSFHYELPRDGME